MAWQTPKTDWNVNDYFNLVDWNRIKENYEYLAQRLSASFITKDITLEDTMALPYYDIVNNLEFNLDSLAKTPATFFPFSKENWYARTSENYVRNPNYEDFNRWESIEAQLKEYYESMSSQVNNLHSGTFTAGNNRVRQFFARGGK